MSGAGMRMGTIVVLTVPGRVSGQPRSTPVAPLTVDGHRYVVAGLPGGDWARNVRAAGQGMLSAGRKRQEVTFTEVADQDTREQVMRAFPKQVRGGVPLLVQLGVVHGPDPNEFAAAAGKVAIFEVLPAT